MGFWAVLVPGEHYRAERLFHRDTLPMPEPLAHPLAPGDEVLLVAEVEPPVVFGSAVVRETATGTVVLSYTRRGFDAPVAAEDLTGGGRATWLAEAAFRRVVAALPAPVDRREWLVSVALPIEAESAADAVRQFWTYVSELGPKELPAFVAPVGDELATRAYVLGEEVSLDPEEGDG